MKCQKCGAEVVAGAVFCQACGTSVVGAPLTSSAADKPGRQRPDAPDSGPEVEEMLWQGRYSTLAMIGSWVAAGAATLALLITGWAVGFSGSAWMWSLGALAFVWIGLALRLLYLQLSVKYSLTNQRFIQEYGLLWRKTDRIETIDIDDVAVEQGPVERMLGVGTVRLLSSDQTTPNFRIVGIENVRRTATMIDDARRQERRKRGLYVESV